MREDKFVMNWDKLLSAKRQRESSSEKSEFDGRNAFEKDYHRIILSASFRRLQDKTQVFPLDQSDFVRTRLTHSLEVSSIAKSLGAQVCSMLRHRDFNNLPSFEQEKEIVDLLACAGLLHDMGNPPFGHYGETTIRDYYKTYLEILEFKGKKLSYYLSEQMKQDLLHFEGNAQVLRLISKLHYLVDEHGMNLSYALINTLMKYPVNSLLVNENLEDIRYNKLGYFSSEYALFKEVTQETGTYRAVTETFKILGNEFAVVDKRVPKAESIKQLGFAPDNGRAQVVRHPLTYLLEAADDISYRTADIEDASRKGKITFRELKNYLHDNIRIKELQEPLYSKYTEVLNKLDDCLVDAKTKHEEKAELYAIQNWLIYIQSVLIKSVSETFVEQYYEIMNGDFIHDLFHDNLAGLILNILGDIAYDFVFSTQSIVELEIAADAVIKGLLAKFVPASIYFDTDIKQKPVDRRLMSIISDNYRDCYFRESKGKSEGEKLYYRLLLVNDYICGMTDSFARDLYYKFNGIYE